MDYFGVKKNGKPVYKPEVQEARRKHWERIKEGQTFNSPLIVPRRGKSHPQCKLIFGHMIEQTVQQSEELGIGVEDLLIYLLNGSYPKGQAITKDFVHQLMYTICPTTDIDGNQVTLSQMDTQQASSLFKRYQTIIAGIGIQIDDPPELEE